MSSTFRPTTAADEPELIGFLERMFSRENTAGLSDGPLLRWKYWEPRPDFLEPRSYIIEKNGQFVAHVGLWPVTAWNGSERKRGIHMIDWASDPQAPGAGASLVQRLTKQYDFICAIGGTAATQAILPKFGFAVAGEAQLWARPLRPWRQMLQHQSRSMRLPVRFARNTWLSLLPRRNVEKGWAAAPSSVGPAMAIVGEPEDSLFQYLERCPDSDCLTFDITRDGRKMGFFALLAVREQARLVGVWLQDPSAAMWRIALCLAQEAALQYTSSSELIARCTSEASSEGAAQAGMLLRSCKQVLLFRKGSHLEPLPLQFQLADNDSLFRGGRQAAFLT